ncbi:MAG TPA: 50S ribosomal protein L3 [Terriglobales bacterium]|nr:50S ribosomal protein L3 [Terriglobales bacterium]
MVNGILGKKIGMSEAYSASGERIPVTLIQAGPCVVVQRKTQARDGYDAAQLGLIEFTKPGRLSKPERQRFEAANLPPCRLLREVPLAKHAEGDGAKVGDQVLAEMFKERDFLDIEGVSKGRGFAGFVKRHHFGGGAATHGSMFHRAPGSIGASAFPSRVLKGMRAAGHMGDAQVTVRNLQVVAVDADENLLAVRGAVPGPNGGYLLIRRAKQPPRARRGFAGVANTNPLKASKRGGKA